MAIKLNLSVATVRNHVHDLLGKLNVGSRIELHIGRAKRASQSSRTD